jgi:hypothetical protein
MTHIEENDVIRKIFLLSALTLVVVVIGFQPKLTIANLSLIQSQSECDIDTANAPAAPNNLRLDSQFASTPAFEVRTQGIWAVWWDPKFDHEQDAAWLLDRLDDVRCRSLLDLAMQDPPNPGRGVYYNVHIHHGGNDSFPNDWGNGQGTNDRGNPFLALPNGAHIDRGNIDHEGFHVFQYSSNSPGFAYAGDSQWYIESAAQWYTVSRDASSELAFVEAGAIEDNPQLALWHSFGNEAPGDPVDWMFQVRQYGMHTYLYYLTEVAGISRDILTAGFYSEVTLSPQEYQFERVGGDRLRNYFADWAAHNAAGFDYLTPAQVTRARLEVENVGDPNNRHRYIAEYVDQGTDDTWMRPPARLTPRSWSYNVIKIRNSSSGNYLFQLQADASGSEGANAHFEVRAVVMTPSGATYYAPSSTNATVQNIIVDVEPNDAEVFFVIAAVPEWFSGNQTYGYEYKISTNVDPTTIEVETNEEEPQTNDAPDEDGDGVPDADDYCPDFPGTAANNGC